MDDLFTTDEKTREQAQAMRRWYSEGLGKLLEELTEKDFRTSYAQSRALARHCKLTQPGIQNVLEGKRPHPRPETMRQIYNALEAL